MQKLSKKTRTFAEKFVTNFILAPFSTVSQHSPNIRFFLLNDFLIYFTLFFPFALNFIPNIFNYSKIFDINLIIDNF